MSVCIECGFAAWSSVNAACEHFRKHRNENLVFHSPTKCAFCPPDASTYETASNLYFHLLRFHNASRKRDYTSTDTSATIAAEFIPSIPSCAVFDSATNNTESACHDSRANTPPALAIHELFDGERLLSEDVLLQIKMVFLTELLIFDSIPTLPKSTVDNISKSMWRCLLQTLQLLLPLSISNPSSVIDQIGSTIQTVLSRHCREQRLVAEGVLIKPSKSPIGTRSSWRKTRGIRRLSIIPRQLAYVPLEQLFSSMFSSADLVSTLVWPSQFLDINSLAHPFCGSRVKELFIENGRRDFICYQAYYDDFGITSPLKPKHCSTKLGGFYGRILNFPAYFHSKIEMHFLDMLVNTQDMKNPLSRTRIFEHQIAQFDALEQSGIDVTFPSGEVKNVPFVFLRLTGDNLGCNELEGFQCSFSSGCCCRICTKSREAMKLNPFEDPLLLRTTAARDTAIAANTFPEGMKRLCPYNNLRNYDNLLSPTVEPVHDILEGEAKHVVTNFVTYCIVEKELFTLEWFNDRITMYPYAGIDASQRPVPIHETVISKHALPKQSASQCFTLVRMLPLLLYPFHAQLEDDDVWAWFLNFQSMIDVVFSAELVKTDVTLLKKLVHYHQVNHIRFFGPCIPKSHFLSHYGYVAEIQGGLRHLSTIRAEAKHQPFKNYATLNRQFQQVHYTLAFKHQLQMMPFFMSIKKGTFLDEYSPAVMLKNSFRKGDVVVISTCNELPEFAKVCNITAVGRMLKLTVVSLTTTHFDSMCHCFVIKEQDETVIEMDALSSPILQSLPLYDDKIRLVSMTDVGMLIQCEIDGNVRVINADVSDGEILTDVFTKIAGDNPWQLSHVKVILDKQLKPANVNDPFTHQLAYYFVGFTDIDTDRHSQFNSTSTNSSPNDMMAMTETDYNAETESTAEPESIVEPELNEHSTIQPPSDALLASPCCDKVKFSQWINSNEQVFKLMYENVPQCFYALPLCDMVDIKASLGATLLGKALVILFRQPELIPDVFTKTARFAFGKALRELMAFANDNTFISAADVNLTLTSVSPLLGRTLDPCFAAYLKPGIRQIRYRYNKEQTTFVEEPRIVRNRAVNQPSGLMRRGRLSLSPLTTEEKNHLFHQMANVGTDEDSVVKVFKESSEIRMRYVLTDETATAVEILANFPGYVRHPLLTLRVDYETRHTLMRESICDFQARLLTVIDKLYRSCENDDFTGTDSLSNDERLRCIFTYLPTLLGKEKRFRTNKPKPFIFETDCIGYDSALNDIKTRFEVSTAFIGISKVSRHMTQYFVNFADCPLPANSFLDALEVFYIAHYVFHVSFEPSILLVCTFIDRILHRPASIRHTYQSVEDLIAKL